MEAGVSVPPTDGIYVSVIFSLGPPTVRFQRTAAYASSIYCCTLTSNRICRCRTHCGCRNHPFHLFCLCSLKN